MSGPFKMKGSPMKRNFGVGSPLHDHERHSEGWVIEHPNQSSATVRELQKENQTTKEYDDAMIKKLQKKIRRKKENEDFKRTK